MHVIHVTVGAPMVSSGPDTPLGRYKSYILRQLNADLILIASIPEQMNSNRLTTMMVMGMLLATPCAHT